MVMQTRSSRRVPLILCAAVMGFVLALAARGEAASYTYTKIAETSSAANGFRLLNIPSLSDDGTVAFSATLNSALTGIFTGDGTTTANPIVDTSGPSGNFGFSFTTLGSPSIDAGTVAFWAILTDSNKGIFTSDGTTITTIAGPSASSFGTNPAINDVGGVAFQTFFTTGGGGIFTGSGGPTTMIADTSGIFSSLSFPSITNTGTVAFMGTLDAGGTGIFTGSGGPTTSIVDTSGVFTVLSFPSTNNGETVTFLGFLNGGSGIFTSNGGTPATIADTSGSFTFFGTPAINDAGGVAFQAFLTTGGTGIFTGPDSIADKVIAVGDPLDGSTVQGLAFSREGLNDAGQVAFFASLADTRRVVFRADPQGGGDPVPLPDPVPPPDPAPVPDDDPVSVTIDIKPGNSQNTVNLGSKGVVRVAILGAINFDAATVDPGSIQLSGAYEKQNGKGTLMAQYKDVNRDGYVDLVVHVQTESLTVETEALSAGTTTSATQVRLDAMTVDGTPIIGSAQVRSVP